jgi:hypothetical protein
VRIFSPDILTFDGLFGSKSDILNPRWLLTKLLLLAWDYTSDARDMIGCECRFRTSPPPPSTRSVDGRLIDHCREQLHLAGDNPRMSFASQRAAAFAASNVSAPPSMIKSSALFLAIALRADFPYGRAVLREYQQHKLAKVGKFCGHSHARSTHRLDRPSSGAWPDVTYNAQPGAVLRYTEVNRTQRLYPDVVRLLECGRCIANNEVLNH